MLKRLFDFLARRQPAYHQAVDSAALMAMRPARPDEIVIDMRSFFDAGNEWIQSIASVAALGKTREHGTIVRISPVKFRYMRHTVCAPVDDEMGMGIGIASSTALMRMIGEKIIDAFSDTDPAA